MILTTSLFTIETDPNSWGIFLSAFMGAFFAYLFTRIGTFADKVSQRKKKHNDALVALETQCNNFLNITGNNRFIVDDFTKIGTRNILGQQPFLYFNELHTFPIDREILKGLANIDLVNDLFSFEETISKTNNSILSVNKFLATMQEAFIGKNIDPHTYFTNIDAIIRKMAELVLFIDDLERENKELAAKSRVLIKKHNKTLYVRFLSKHLHIRFTPKQLDQVKQELKALNQEIAETSTKDRERIDKVVAQFERNKK